MGIEFDFYYLFTAIHIIAIVMLFFMGCLTVTRKPSRLQVSNVLVILFALFYTVGYFQQMNAVNLEVAQAGFKVQYVGISGILLAYTWFMFEYNGKMKGKWVLMIEAIFSTISLVYIFRLETNTLFIKTLSLVPYKNHLVIKMEAGILYNCYYFYFLATFFISTYIYIGKMKESVGTERRRIILFFCATICTFLSTVIDILNPNLEYDFYTIGILGFAILFSIAVNQADFLNSVQTEQELDPLTKLNHRRYFVEQIQQKLNNKKAGSLVMFDMDNFKFINDHYGHQVGDEVLKALGNALKSVTKQEDYACRLGGDEFCLYLFNITNRREIETILEKVVSSYRKELIKQGIRFDASFSIGIAVHDGKEIKSFEEIYDHADKALYLVKNSGKGKSKFYE